MRPMTPVSIVLVGLLLASCSGPGKPEQPTTTEEVTMSDELVPGYKGGCKEGFTLYSQNQFTVDGAYGTKIRRTLDSKGEGAGLFGNDQLRAVGWIRTQHVFYRDNPEGLRGEVWYYIPDLPGGGSGWVPDAGVRAVKTEHAPDDLDEYFRPETQAALQPPECELLPR